jgi:hypothetical protein
VVLAPLPLALTVALTALEVLGRGLLARPTSFATLTSIYLNDALHPATDGPSPSRPSTLTGALPRWIPLLRKYIGAGLACLGMAGAGIGLGNLFGQFLSGALRNRRRPKASAAPCCSASP